MNCLNFSFFLTLLSSSFSIAKAAPAEEGQSSRLLHRACPMSNALYENDFDAARALIAQGIGANDFVYSPPIVNVARSGNLAAVRFLLDHGADLSCTGHNGRHVLVAAAESNNLELMQLLVSLGCDVNVVDEEYNLTSLHAAICAIGSLKIVKFLVEKGADLTVRDIFGGTVLHQAAFTSDPETFEYLLQREEAAELLRVKDHKGEDVLEVLKSEHCEFREQKQELLAKYFPSKGITTDNS